MTHPMHMNRRQLLQRLLAASAATAMPFSYSLAATGNTGAGSAGEPLTRPIPSTGDPLPMVGLGTWITFNVGDNQALLDQSARVMEAFFEDGGRMIDSSPMYGSSQDTVGYGLDKLDAHDRVFSTDKVWTRDEDAGPSQIRETRDKWGISSFDLMQVHNLVGWRGHLDTLKQMKANGELPYVGITTSHGRRHDLVEQIMASEPIDFVQITYNPVDREVESRILPLARDKGIAVIVNRPFRQGALTERLRNEPLPSWAGDVGADSWAQLILKFILAAEAVTCAIPATTRVDHVRENLAAATSPLPDAATRERIARVIRAL